MIFSQRIIAESLIEPLDVGQGPVNAVPGKNRLSGMGLHLAHKRNTRCRVETRSHGAVK